MKVRRAEIEKLMELNEKQPVLKQPFVKAGQYSARFFVNEKPSDSCLPIPELTLRTLPCSQAH